MNYNWQIPHLHHGTWALDYSRKVLNPVDENALNESNDIGGDPADTFIRGKNPRAMGPVLPMGGTPVDWNDNHVTETMNYALDVNDDMQFSNIHGYNDWEHLRFYFLESRSFGDGIHVEGSDEAEEG
jgi:hypothetical protein